MIRKGMGTYSAMILPTRRFPADVANGDAESGVEQELEILTTDKSDDGKIHITIGGGGMYPETGGALT